MIDLSKYLTTYKWGKPVLTGSGKTGAFDERAVDCPVIFQHNEQFFMSYVGFNGIGYQTALATSKDLLNWIPYDIILRRGESTGWDSLNSAGTWILKENALDKPPLLKKYKDKYWLVYHAYPGDGYEEGPGRIGLAWTEDETLRTWNRLPNPILTPEAGESWERGGLYKACLLEHAGKFYIFYNAKNIENSWTEQTGLAISEDMIHWKRIDANPVLRVSQDRWDSQFVSDPCVHLDGDQWVMYFFGYNGRNAQEGIAFSKDLLHWDKFPDPILRVGQPGDIDSIHAHKPAIVQHEDVLYHYYCACRPSLPGDITVNGSNEFRTITVATSKHLF